MNALQRLWAALKRQVNYYLLLFIEGDHGWGQPRLMGALFVIALFVFLNRLFEQVPPLAWLEKLYADLQLSGPVLQLVDFFISFTTPQVFRHLIPPLIGFALALLMGALYLRDLLELPNLSQAFGYLNTTVFGGNYHRMTISEGQATVSDPETNPLLKVGGPGWVHIKLGSAALFERVAGPSAVREAGTHFLRRFETLREAFDLREVERSRKEVQVFTKDGLPLILDEVKVRFRLRARGARTPENPYPLLPSAIRQAVYTRTVGEKGLTNWNDMIVGSAVGTITNWIARRRLDELIPPPVDQDEDAPEAHPEPPYRQSIHQLFFQNQTRQRFADMGAEILWVAVGHLRPDPDIDPDVESPEAAKGHDKIHTQMVDTWKSNYQAMVREEQAQAQGYAEWLEETARIQAQVEMIQALTKGLQEAREAGTSISDLITLRGVEYLQALAERPALPEPGKKNDRPDQFKLLEDPNRPSDKK